MHGIPVDGAVFIFAGGGFACRRNLHNESSAGLHGVLAGAGL